LRAILSNTLSAGFAKLSALVPLSEQIVRLSGRIGALDAEKDTALFRSEFKLIESVTWDRVAAPDPQPQAWCDTCTGKHKP